MALLLFGAILGGVAFIGYVKREAEKEKLASDAALGVAKSANSVSTEMQYADVAEPGGDNPFAVTDAGDPTYNVPNKRGKVADVDLHIPPSMDDTKMFQLDDLIGFQPAQEEVNPANLPPDVRKYNELMSKTTQKRKPVRVPLHGAGVESDGESVF
jgi:hypothetical protein